MKILALDLGKFKSVACCFDTEQDTTEYWTLSTDRGAGSQAARALLGHAAGSTTVASRVRRGELNTKGESAETLHKLIWSGRVSSQLCLMANIVRNE